MRQPSIAPRTTSSTSPSLPLRALPSASRTVVPSTKPEPHRKNPPKNPKNNTRAHLYTYIVHSETSTINKDKTFKSPELDLKCIHYEYYELGFTQRTTREKQSFGQRTPGAVRPRLRNHHVHAQRYVHATAIANESLACAMRNISPRFRNRFSSRSHRRWRWMRRVKWLDG